MHPTDAVDVPQDDRDEQEQGRVKPRRQQLVKDSDAGNAGIGHCL